MRGLGRVQSKAVIYWTCDSEWLETVHTYYKFYPIAAVVVRTELLYADARLFCAREIERRCSAGCRRRRAVCVVRRQDAGYDGLHLFPHSTKLKYRVRN